MIQDVGIKSFISMEKRSIQQEEDCFYHHTERNFNEEINILLHLEHSLFWCWSLEEQEWI